MVETPWGDAATLRERMLRPGARAPREEVARSQRERLFAATVAIVSERGYEATTVADLVDLSGVSRSAFYEHFRNKQECFLATLEAIVGFTLGKIAEKLSEGGTGEEQAQRAMETFAELIAEQPAAARVCFVEIYAAGPAVSEPVEHALSAAEALVAQAREGIPGQAGMPPLLLRAMIGGTRKIIHTRLYRHQEAELPELVPQLLQLGFSIAPPPRPLRSRARRARPPLAWSEATDQPGGIMLAVAETIAEQGYQAATVTEIVKRASVSLSTFYAHFDDKQGAVQATLDSGGTHLLAAALPAARRAPDWAPGVRAGLRAAISFLATNPAFAQLALIDAYGAGPRALEERDRMIEGLAELLAPGYELAPEVPPIAAEFVGGAIFAALAEQLKVGGAASLPKALALTTYLALAPFTGAAEACAIANAGPAS